MWNEESNLEDELRWANERIAELEREIEAYEHREEANRQEIMRLRTAVRSQAYLVDTLAKTSPEMEAASEGSDS